MKKEDNKENGASQESKQGRQSTDGSIQEQEGLERMRKGRKQGI